MAKANSNRPKGSVKRGSMGASHIGGAAFSEKNPLTLMCPALCIGCIAPLFYSRGGGSTQAAKASTSRSDETLCAAGIAGQNSRSLR